MTGHQQYYDKIQQYFVHIEEVITIQFQKVSRPLLTMKNEQILQWTRRYSE